MHFLAPTATVLCLASAALASLNTTRAYYLKTSLKANQPKKTRFNNLYLESYHTGAGLSDAVFSAENKYSAKGFLNATSVKRTNGKLYDYQEFDLGDEFPFSLVVDAYVNSYSSWEPVRINAGGSTLGGFFINATGLQWDSNPGQPMSDNTFAGWMVCEWWHEQPQLFMRWT